MAAFHDFRIFIRLKVNRCVQLYQYQSIGNYPCACELMFIGFSKTLSSFGILSFFIRFLSYILQKNEVLKVFEYHYKL